jgi:glycerol-3-phosphate acyltransferase PlsX
MQIAVDAMGGDFAPREVVLGAVKAAASMDCIKRLYLVGEQGAVQRELGKHARVPASIEVVHASEVVEMDDAPAQAVRRKKDSSINRAVDLVKDGRASAVVSAGNTGAVVVSATLKLRTLDGVLRPAIAAVLPTRKRPLILIDAGANIVCDAELLAQFAAMGTVYSREILKQREPVVGLLSIGDEDVKGNDMTKQTFQVLSKSHLNFRGNVEGHDLFEGETDVVVCDGFVGNIVLKTSESAAMAIGHWLKQEMTRNPWRMVGAAMLRGAFRAMKKRMDPELFGGAPLLGARGVCIITHGASSSIAIYHAIRVACESIGHQLNDQIVAEVAKLAPGN